jgi:hypothetical protein
MSEPLRVRAYGGPSGDAVLVSIPEKAGRKVVTRHLLIDLCHALDGSGGGGTVLEPVVRDIRDVLDGRPLDLYVMSHQHRDHVQGLYVASTTDQLDLDVDYAWLTASSARDYHDAHPMAKKRRDALRAAYLGIERLLAAAPTLHSPTLRELILNNDPRQTEPRLNDLRDLARVKTSYIHRGCELEGTHPFDEATFEVLAPEEDTTAYDGRLPPLALGVGDGPRAKPALLDLVPPAGVDAGAFFDLVEARRRGYAEALLEIDRAANNSSIVFTLEWRGWRLLFPGHAEGRSWRTIKNQLGTLKPVDFLKVGRNGHPPAEILEEIFPKTPRERGRRKGLVCTYAGAPDEESLGQLRRRCTFASVGPGGPLEFTFPG